MEELTESIFERSNAGGGGGIGVGRGGGGEPLVGDGLKPSICLTSVSDAS